MKEMIKCIATWESQIKQNYD